MNIAPSTNMSMNDGSSVKSNTYDPLPQQSSLFGADNNNIRSLIVEKEKELHDINEYRIRTLEGLLREKEQHTNEWKQKFHKLKEDFQYNLKLIEDRDEELDRHEEHLSQLKNVLRERENELSEVQVLLSDEQHHVSAAKNKSAEQEIFYQKKLKELREEMENTRWRQDDDARRAREEQENARRVLEHQLHDKEELLDTQRREMSLTFEDAMREREAEFKTQHEHLVTNHRDLELKFKSVQRELEQTRARNSELRQSLDELQVDLQDQEKEARTATWELEDVRQLKDAKISELEEEKLDLQNIKQSLLDEYEGKMAELLQSLHSVERAFMKQKEHYEEELRRAGEVKSEEFKLLSTRNESRIESLNHKLRTTEESLESITKELKQTKWQSQDQVAEHSRVVEMIKAELGDTSAQTQVQLREAKRELLTLTAERTTAKDNIEHLTRTLAEHRETLAQARAEAAGSHERTRDLESQLASATSRQVLQAKELELELRSRFEPQVKELEAAKNRLGLDKQTLDDRLSESESELQRVRQELYTLRAHRRVEETFGSHSPMFSEDMGSASPIKGYSFSPVRQGPPPAPGAPVVVPGVPPSGSVSSSLSSVTELAQVNEKLVQLSSQNDQLKSVIRDMRRQMEQASSTHDQDPANQDDAAQQEPLRSQLKQQQDYCAFLQRRVEECEQALRDQTLMQEASSDQTTAELKTELVKVQEELTRVRAQAQGLRQELESTQTLLAQARKTIEQTATGGPTTSENRPASLIEAEIGELKDKLAHAHEDIERLMVDRNKLMETSNQLRAQVSKSQGQAQLPPAQVQQVIEHTRAELSRQYERQLSDLSTTLKEIKSHNKALKRELKHSALSRRASSSVSVSSSKSDDFDHQLLSSPASSSISSSSIKRLEDRGFYQHPPSSLPDDEELVTNARGWTSSVDESLHSAESSPLNSKKKVSARGKFIDASLRTMSELRAKKLTTSSSAKTSTNKTSKTTAKIPNKGSSTSSSPGTKSTKASSKMSSSDARLRLQHARSLLDVSGRKAAISMQKQKEAGISQRSTESQLKVSGHLAASARKRQDLANERKAVRNYNIVED